MAEQSVQKNQSIRLSCERLGADLEGVCRYRRPDGVRARRAPRGNLRRESGEGGENLCVRQAGNPDAALAPAAGAVLRRVRAVRRLQRPAHDVCAHAGGKAAAGVRQPDAHRRLCAIPGRRAGGDRRQAADALPQQGEPPGRGKRAVPDARLLPQAFARSRGYRGLPHLHAQPVGRHRVRETVDSGKRDRALSGADKPRAFCATWWCARTAWATCWWCFPRPRIRCPRGTR